MSGKRKIEGGVEGISEEKNVNPAAKWEAAFETFYAFTPESTGQLQKNPQGVLRNTSGIGLHVTVITKQEILNNRSLHNEINKLITNGLLGGVEFDKDGNVRQVHFREDIAQKLGNSQTFIIDNPQNLPNQPISVNTQVLGISHDAYKITTLAIASILANVALSGIEKTQDERNLDKKTEAHPSTTVDTRKGDIETPPPAPVQAKKTEHVAKKPKIVVMPPHVSRREEKHREKVREKEKENAREVRNEAKKEAIETDTIKSQIIKNEQIQKSNKIDPTVPPSEQPNFRQLGS